MISVDNTEGIINIAKPHVAGYLKYGETPTNVINFIVNRYKPKTCLDVGCGPFGSMRIFKSLGIYVWGIDGDDQILYRDDLKEFYINFSIVDLERSPYFFPVKFDLVWSYEVAEHIENSENFVLTITENCNKILAITHAVPGQGGYHHVNCQDDNYWVNKICSKGFRYLNDISLNARKLGDTYFSRSGLIFERI